MNKDELLNKIVELEASFEKDKNDYESRLETIKPLEEEKDALQHAYESIKLKLEEKAAELSDLKYDIDSLKRRGKSTKLELERLRRELSRLLDTERINQEYLDKIEEFRNKCLDAPWRKENRTDGFGAYTHQIEGAIHLAVAKQALLGDKRGLGKTATSLIYCDLVEARKVIVICPSDTMDNFIREVKLWTPHRRHSIIKLGKMTKGMRDFVLPQLKHTPEFMLVLNYAAWRKDPQLIKDLIDLKADALIEDEAHHAMNLNTLTGKGVVNLRFGLNQCPGCDNPDVTVDRHDNATCMHCMTKGFITDFCSIKYVLPMTGTPILNRPQELFPHLRVIDPANFKTMNQFLRDFCYKGASGHWTWQYGAEKKVVDKIGPRYLARDRKSAGVIIPPPTPVDHIITMEEIEENYPKQYEAYMQARQYAQIVLDPDKDIAMSMPIFITVILRLRQVMVWPAGIELKDGDEVIARLNVYESAKLDKAEELIREIIEEKERVVLFSQFKPPLHELQRRIGDNIAIYDGSTSDYMKNQIALDFDPKTVGRNPQWDAVMCNYKSAGEGLNFHSASHMVILDEEWNPGKQSQAYGRIDRLGQTKETTIHTIRAEPSIDSWMAALIQEKAELIGGFEAQADLSQKMYQALKDGEI